jgi:hypothetical protein
MAVSATEIAFIDLRQRSAPEGRLEIITHEKSPVDFDGAFECNQLDQAE